MKTKIIILILACIAWIATLLAFSIYQQSQQAYLKGQQDKYIELQSKLSELGIKAESLSLEIKRVQESIVPEASDLKLPDQQNSKGDTHPKVVNSGTLKNFIFNNCSSGTIAITDTIIQYSTNKGIRPEIVFAIAWADSACARNLTTPNNPGNVNNNDRGNRVGYFTLEDGYKAIVDTLNNTHLRGLTMVGQLSQGGRTGTTLYKGIGAKYSCADAPSPYKCYATSTENHFNNTMRALIAMGLNPTASWEFRIK